jgi:hypothetical protein
MLTTVCYVTQIVSIILSYIWRGDTANAITIIT